MNYLQFISHSKGLYKLPYRFLLILRRFGFTEKRLEEFMSEIERLFKSYPFRPTIFVTAKILEKRPHILDRFKEAGCETAIHGYVHINYSELSAEEQSNQMQKAKDLLSNGKPQSLGFRAPYLSWNRNTISAMKSNDMGWSSHQPVIWDCFRSSDFQKSEIENYQRVLAALYNPKLANKFPVVPYFTDGLLEVPVSLPDDEILIDRFRISDPDKLFEIWNNILLQTHERGDLFTLLLHPERSPIYISAIRRLIEQAVTEKQSCWMASLREISDWWKERASSEVQVVQVNKGQYRVHISCSERTNILFITPTSNGSNIVKERDFVIKTKIKPIIGISPNASPRLLEFLKNEGFPCEIAQEGEKYAFHIEKGDDFTERQYMDLLDEIEKRRIPLLRVQRWPKGYKSAFSVTFDLDAVTLQDFLSRAFEFSDFDSESVVRKEPEKNSLPAACMLGYFNYQSDGRVQNYVNFLIKLGFAVDVICIGKGNSRYFKRNDGKVTVFPLMERNKKETSKVKYILNLIVFFSLSTCKISILFLRKRYRFIHVHNVPDFLAFTAWFPKILGSKIILDIHDIFPELYARKYKVGLKSLTYKILLLIEKISCKFADHIIVSNDIWRDQVGSRTLTEHKSTAIPNFPDRQLFSINGTSPPPMHGKNKPFTMMYHGSFTEHHGLDIAIKAIGLLRDQHLISSFHLFLYGEGQSKPYIVSLISAMKMECFVSIMPPVALQDIPSLIQDADIGVVPKRDGLFVGDALSTKLFEYVAMGIPVVISRTRAAQRYFDEAEVRYFTPEDSKDMAESIYGLYKNPDLRAAMAQRALMKIDNYNIEANAKKYLDIVEKL